MNVKTPFWLRNWRFPLANHSSARVLHREVARRDIFQVLNSILFSKLLENYD